ncbi:MAG TPA: ABC transporter ATP-binding protein [Frankiaceae bacterium]|jgi:ABC-2 type transport system ATP-binding protein|nr:ABC transporter ATP-binding protein [Frankiaceae bacterium]
MSEAAIGARDLVVVRGKKTVLSQLSFEVPAATVTGLLGPSGCGKTTLMRSAIGVQRIRSGALDILGRPAGDPALRTQVGYASQGASVYLDLTVLENIRYFAAALRAPASDVTRVIDEVDLASHRKSLTGQLSGGERSRVSLAVALLGTPKLLVLDEPTVGLDPVLREQLWDLFSRLAKGGMTLLVSSHVMDEAERCDALLLMREGQLLAHETPAALKQRTGTSDLDSAFLHLLRKAGAGT